MKRVECINFINNNRGVGLIGVMIASLIAGVVALSVVQVMNNMYRGVSNVQKTVDISDAVSEVKMAMVDSQNCIASLPNFSSKNFDSSILSNGFIVQNITIDKLATASGTTLVQKDQPVKGIATSNLNKMSLANLQTINTSSGLFLADIAFDVEKGGNSLGVQKITRKFPVIIEATNLGGTRFQIAKCYSSSTGTLQDIKNILSQSCGAQGGTFVEATSKCLYTNSFCTNSDINTCFNSISNKISTLEARVNSSPGPASVNPPIAYVPPQTPAPVSTKSYGPPTYVGDSTIWAGLCLAGSCFNSPNRVGAECAGHYSYSVHKGAVQAPCSSFGVSDDYGSPRGTCTGFQKADYVQYCI
ncbi:MAG: hypothetical protein L6Q37_11415 [Bdellovibrionaceae bacterium]|nr:hypothetical protein [Pseudobdellovibrionaceae bacterium]NUM58066.1 hypothetical protein [Pseudobdellovibrionaceae bacterium]